jgi:hypothetical protein
MEPDATENPDGSWTLTWTAPEDASEYIVKYGEKTLVENLDFDQVTRKYRINANNHMNFWAATNVQGEPTPGAAGTQETWTTPVLPAGNWKFGVKALLRSPAATPPQTVLDVGTVLEDESVLLDVLSNDHDLEGSIDTTSVLIEAQPGNGQAAVQAGGTILYTPNANFNGDDFLSYSVSDETGLRSGMTTVHVVVQPVNDPPLGVDDYFDAEAGETLMLDVLQNDQDVDSPELQVLRLIDPELHGTIELQPDGRTIRYTAPSQVIPERFRYVLQDDYGEVDSASVYVEMTPVAVDLSDVSAQNTVSGVLLSANLASDEDIVSVRVLRSRNGGPLEEIPGVLESPARDHVTILDPGSGLEDGDLVVYRFQALMRTGERRLVGAQVQIIYTPPGPREYALEQSRPNPFNPRTVISFAILKPAHTTLCIYDVMGRQVNCLVNEKMEAGRYSIEWDGTDRRGLRVASGTYYYRLISGRFARTKSMQMVK